MNRQSRREFLNRALVASTAGILCPRTSAAEPPPETGRLRIQTRLTICEAPSYVAEELLRAEGFSEITYLKLHQLATGRWENPEERLISGEADVMIDFSPDAIVQIDAGAPVVFLSGVHVGCIEVFAGDRVRAISDLKGKTLIVWSLGTSTHLFFAMIAAHVGLDAARDVNWNVNPKIEEWPRLLQERKIDAFLGFPPLSQEMRAKGIGRVLMKSLTDRPWSQYFCCMVVGNKEFVRRNPIATKRAVRAILKASELCALQPDKTAKLLVDKGYVERNDYAVESMTEVAYGKRRDYEPADAIRFYALRLHETGMIKSSPQKIIAHGTDWRFLNELKKELKG